MGCQGLAAVNSSRIDKLILHFWFLYVSMKGICWKGGNRGVGKGLLPEACMELKGCTAGVNKQGISSLLNGREGPRVSSPQ